MYIQELYKEYEREAEVVLGPTTFREVSLGLTAFKHRKAQQRIGRRQMGQETKGAEKQEKCSRKDYTRKGNSRGAVPNQRQATRYTLPLVEKMIPNQTKNTRRTG